MNCVIKMKYPKYYGILKGYPRIRKAFGKLSDYVSLCRPFTLLGAFLAGFFLDVLFSKFSPNGINILHAFLVGITLAFLQGGGQCTNQAIAEECEIDKLNGKDYRPTVNGKISLKEAKIISLALFSFGILLAFCLSFTYGIFSLLIAFFAIAYTVPPLRIKKYFLLNNIWQGIARGLLPAVYVSSIYSGYGSLPLLFGVVLVLWIVGGQATKDFCDVRGDKIGGIKTFPVVLGEREALMLMQIFMSGAFALLNLFIFFGLFPSSFIALNILILPSIFIIVGLKKGLKSEYFENNISWGFFYGCLMLWYFIPAVLI